MQLITLAAAVLAVAPAVAIPPEDFGFPSAPNDTMLGVRYGSVNVREGDLLGPEGKDCPSPI